MIQRLFFFFPVTVKKDAQQESKGAGKEKLDHKGENINLSWDYIYKFTNTILGNLLCSHIYTYTKIYKHDYRHFIMLE